MYRTFLSWRYMRSRPTNWIGIMGIFVGVGALILILSIMSGFLAESRRAVRGSLADLIVQPLRMGEVGSAQAVVAAILEHPDVAGVTVQLHWGGMLTWGGRYSGYVADQLAQPNFADLPAVQIIGIDVESELRTTEFARALQNPENERDRCADLEHPFAPPPDYRPQGRPLSGIIVGEQLMQALDFRRGQDARLLVPVPVRDKSGNVELTVNDRQYVVAGAYRSGENDVDLDTVYLPREELVEFLGGAADYSQILVRLVDYERDGERVAAEINARLAEKDLLERAGPLRVRTWEQFKQGLIGAIENEKMLMGIMLSLVLVVAGFNILAILSMLVTEKRRDIGILCALGATSRGILVLFLLIGFWDALLGATLGALVGVWGALRIDSIERWISSTFNIQIFNREVYLFDHIPTVVDPVGVALIVVGAFACTLVFAALPAIKAARMHPLDALRYE